jgi:hypothetical protein
MRNTQSGIVKFQVRSSWKYLLAPTPKSQLHNAHALHSWWESDLDIVVHLNFLLSEVTDILESDHLPIVISILDPVRTKDTLDPAEKLTNWGLFQSLACELVFSNIRIYSSNEAEKQYMTLQLL